VFDFEDLDYYELLGVSRTASVEEIKRAYRREISKYHPDRFVNAAPADQEYAQRRSQRLTEAHAVLGDFTSRNAYNRGQPLPSRRSPFPRPSVAASQPRDFQAELYSQAQAHLASGRTLQAIGTLRQLQQINPFYRDTADLIARAEADLQTRQHPPEPERRTRRVQPLAIAGGMAVVVAIALGSWALLGRSQPDGQATAALAPTAISGPPTIAPTVGVAATTSVIPEPGATTISGPPTTAPAIAVAATTSVTPEPEATPSSVPASPTEAPAPTASAEPPTEPPATETPTSPPPTLTPVVESGALLVSDGFDTARWIDTRGANWSVGYQGDRYRIVAAPGIGTVWSYRSSPQPNYSVGVDMEVVNGEGGLLLRFANESNYLSFVVNPAQGSYRLGQLSGGELTQVVNGTSPAIRAGAVNRVTARLRGNQIELFANGELLASVEARTGGSLRYGLLAVAGATAAEVLFDNLEIRSLD
jgi:hypothetical protein